MFLENYKSSPRPHFHNRCDRNHCFQHRRTSSVPIPFLIMWFCSWSVACNTDLFLSECIHCTCSAPERVCQWAAAGRWTEIFSSCTSSGKNDKTVIETYSVKGTPNSKKMFVCHKLPDLWGFNFNMVTSFFSLHFLFRRYDYFSKWIQCKVNVNTV